MYLKIVNEIQNNVFSTKISIEKFGTDSIPEDEEKKMIAKFPTEFTCNNSLFTKNIKVIENEVFVTDEEVGDDVTTVTIPISSKEKFIKKIDENFEFCYEINSKKITSDQMNTVLTTPELVSVAYCKIFASVVKETMEKIMSSIRTKAPIFEGQITYII